MSNANPDPYPKPDPNPDPDPDTDTVPDTDPDTDTDSNICSIDLQAAYQRFEQNSKQMPVTQPPIDPVTVPDTHSSLQLTDSAAQKRIEELTAQLAKTREALEASEHTSREAVLQSGNFAAAQALRAERELQDSLAIARADGRAELLAEMVQA